MKLPIVSNPIRLTAVITVAIVSTYVMWMGWSLIETLASPGWCKTALGAEKVSGTEGTVKGLDACVSLLTIQLQSLSTTSLVYAGSIALCLAVLMVIVIAGARLEVKASRDGVEFSTDRSAPAAAEAVADAAVEKAEEIKADV